MSSRPELVYREQFAAALVDQAAAAHPPNLDAFAACRFRVYRNNVHGVFIAALVDAYPVVQRLVGEEFFAAMAREFFLAEPARGASLALYGAGFAEFIEGFEPAAAVAYLADVARLERARLEALHAADSAVLDAANLPADGDRLLIARFELHPGLRLVCSGHPIVSIWHANQADADIASIEAARESALVTRPLFEVKTRVLDEAAGAFTYALMQGARIQQSYQRAAAMAGDFDVGAVFSQLLDAGAFTRALID